MKLLANENFPYASVKYLIAKSFDIIAIGVDNPGITDKEVMDIAIEESRTIITFDRDYGELIFKHNYKPNNGVIYLRFDKYESDEPGKIIEKLLANFEYDFNRALTVVTKDAVRQKKYSLDKL